MILGSRTVFFHQRTRGFEHSVAGEDTLVQRDSVDVSGAHAAAGCLRFISLRVPQRGHRGNIVLCIAVPLSLVAGRGGRSRQAGLNAAAFDEQRLLHLVY